MLASARCPRRVLSTADARRSSRRSGYPGAATRTLGAPLFFFCFLDELVHLLLRGLRGKLGLEERVVLAGHVVERLDVHRLAERRRGLREVLREIVGIPQRAMEQL